MAEIKNKSGAAGMAVFALGVVFGDIGTSPLYAYQLAVSMAGAHAAHLDALFGGVGKICDVGHAGRLSRRGRDFRADGADF